ncbi:TrmH family RNA methyltransferase [Mangrovibacterium diazotrophicum]|uniref:TrmH family RNA methyltransferase n=1 Tax=Mangrovibacterium diazotrophicum TaxID=1261403 RepID=A0A419W6S9_9BACT|nr:RNA methyltransferase [Mangrovibacterium diazotrophicum]RKD91166.1 TrmH family RNA methyltransferase [Mangrovibacterium diazotrophicum]
MLSKNKIKFIQSLARKKNREAEKLFLVEGDKMVVEALESSLSVRLLAATDDFLATNSRIARKAAEVVDATAEEIRKASLLQSPQHALAVVEMPQTGFEQSMLTSQLSLALDFIQDPGNLGTIIRLADWFGIEHLLCSENTVDCFNPKVIQASMGAIFRVKVHYLNLPEVLKKAQTEKLPVYGAFLEGENIYEHNLGKAGILVMGNEGNGISPEVEQTVTDKIHIPSFATNGTGSESLNVSMATGICLSEFRRRN